MNDNQEIVFDPTAVENINQNSVEQAGLLYPTIQWHYGNISLRELGGMKYFGGFFLSEGAIDEAELVAAGWQKTTYDHPDGSQTQGFWRRELAVAVIAMRKRWDVYQENSRTPQLFAWSDYETALAAGRPSSRTHVLCLVKGLTELGPFVLTLKGLAGMAFEGTNTRGGALTEFAQTVISKANRESDAAALKANKPTGKRWPFRCFWLPVGAARDAKGEPVFTDAGKGANAKRVVLPAALGLPAKAEDVNLSRFYVGNDLLTVGNTLYAEAEANWTHAWDKLNPQGAQATDGGSELPSQAGQRPQATAGVAAPTVPAAAPSADQALLAALGL